MKNVDIKIDQKGVMTINVDLKKDFGLSKSGKSIIIASTGGNIEQEGEFGSGVCVGVNVYRYKDKG